MGPAVKKRICLNQSVLDFMDSVLCEDSFVLEFGAGWSTRWLADRCRKLVSFETSETWADLVEEDLKECKCDWTIHLVDEPADALDGIDAVDLALIDGVEIQRDDCARLAWPLLRHGGWLIFDDAQRDMHADTVAWLNQFGDGIELEWREGDIESAVERLAIAWQKA